MTPSCADALAVASRLVTYPVQGYVEDLDALVARVEPSDRDAARALAAFADRVRGLPVEAQQELFTQTFDLNPVCALEVGWHLFGEEYERGAFLVRVRQTLRQHGVDEGGELPDHLAAMLLLVAKLDSDEADLLITNALIPAIDKMLEALEKSESPFLPLLKAVRQVLAASRTAADGAAWGAGAPADEVIHG